MPASPGRTAVVTGAASGLGLAMAQRFAAAGLRVVLSDVEAATLDSAVEGLRAGGHEVLGVVADVADAAAVRRLADTAFDAYGAVHVLCNNAGVVKRARTWELTADDWAWVMGVDFYGVVHGLQAFVPRMLEQGGGHVVNTASMAALLPIPNLGAYTAAKSAVLGLTLSLRTEVDQAGLPLGVSVLCPGFIATAIQHSARNRPGELADAASPPPSPRTSAGVEATMTADDVAEQVYDAVLTNRFWILTHPEYQPVIRQHAAAVGTDDAPRPAPIW